MLPICMEIFEKLVHKQLSHYLDRNNILSENQSGFRPIHSTQTCLLNVSDYLLENMNSGYFTGAVFLDLRKAFDTVHHGRLISKLHHFGVRDLELDWFSSYLSGRQQITKIGDNYSNLAGVNFGVPQGSVLGPLLFTLYINDLANTVSPDSVMFLYADDSAVFTSDKSVEDVSRVLNRDMVEISKWLQVNCLTLNTNKTKCMLFGSQAKLRRSENNLHVVINNTAIDKQYSH